MDTAHEGIERPAEVEGIDLVDAVELLAPLHGAGAEVPEPSPDVGQRFTLAEPGFNLGERRLHEPLLGDVPGDAGNRLPDRRRRDGRQRQRDRHQHAVAPFDLGFDVIDVLACGDGVEQCLGRRLQVDREQLEQSRPTISPPGTPRCARRCGSSEDVAGGVLAEHGVDGGVEHGLEERQASRVRPGRRASARRAHVPPSQPPRRRPERRPHGGRGPRSSRWRLRGSRMG